MLQETSAALIHFITVSIVQCHPALVLAKAEQLLTQACCAVITACNFAGL